MKRFPPSQGLKWVKGSFSLLKTQTYRLVLIGLILQFLTGFSQAGTFGLLFVMAIPALSAGVLQAMYMVSNGLVPPVMVLFVAFQSSARLLRLFVLSLVLMAAGLLAASSVMSGSIDAIGPDILGALERGDVAALQAADPEVLQMLAASALTGLAVSGLLAYFTIPLVWFSGYTLGRAIGVGLKALLRNILPFLVQVAALFVLAIPLGMLLSLMLAAGGSMFMSLLVLLLMVLYQLLLFGSQYNAFQDVFGVQGPDPNEDSDQLVA